MKPEVRTMEIVMAGFGMLKPKLAAGEGGKRGLDVLIFGWQWKEELIARWNGMRGCEVGFRASYQRWETL